MHESTRAAVLIFAFRRIDSLGRILEVLSTSKERNIYFSIDSEPETNAPNPIVLETIKDFAKQSTHKVQIWTHETHLGLQSNCKSAIQRFFTLESSGIVLDDDIIPSHAFFASLDSALEVFEADEDVFFINGWTPLLEHEVAKKPYFTEYFISWGWASWSRKILQLNFNMVEVKRDFLKEWRPFGYLHNLGFRLFWFRRFLTVSSPDSRSWDWELLFSLWTRKGKTVSVHERLCTNIGYDSHASHPNHGNKRQIHTARNIPILGRSYWNKAEFRSSLARKNEALLWDLGIARITSSLRYRMKRVLNFIGQN